MFKEKRLILFKGPETFESGVNHPDDFNFHSASNDSLKQVNTMVDQAQQGIKAWEVLNRPKTELKALRESGLLPEDIKWSSTANAEAFFAFGNTLWGNPETRVLFERKELTIIYPGAGTHLSPLEMGIQIAGREIKLTLHSALPLIVAQGYDLVNSHSPPRLQWGILA